MSAGRSASIAIVLPVFGCSEFQPLRVQRLTLERAQRGDEFRARPFRQLEQAAVLRIADQRMLHVRHVHADLVRAPGFEAAFDQGHRAEAFAHAVVGDRVAAILAHRLFQAIVRVATDRRIDAAAGDHRAVHDRRVLAMHRRARDNCSTSDVCARNVRATTIRPEVSLSSRCTMPPRGISASLGS